MRYNIINGKIMKGGDCLKIRYLPIDDRNNLRLLRHTQDRSVILAILGSIFNRPLYTLQALWEYRKWFLELTDDEIRENPPLAFGKAQILQMQGNVKEAISLLDYIDKNHSYFLITKLMLQGLDIKEKPALIKAMEQHNWHFKNMLLTAGRPSVMNGAWDLSSFAEEIALGEKGEIYELLKILYPEGHQRIFDCILAETLYQRDDCYNALVHIVSQIPMLKETEDMRLLFPMLTHEIFILVLNGQAQGSESLIENMRNQLVHNNLEAYLPNIDAFDAWAAMYDGDYARVGRWLREGAPDEISKFCMLDLFRYMVKMRAYIILGKHLAVEALANRLIPLLEEGNRYMDLCELHIICAMNEFAIGEGKNALDHFEKAVALAEKFRFDRVIADEGIRVLEIIKLYIKEREKTPYLLRIKELAEKVAIIHPKYLKKHLPKNPALTETEMKILRLLSVNYTNSQIADITETAIDTVKQHCKHICAKLEVKNRHQAVDRAIELGMLEPVRAGTMLNV